MEGDAGRGDPIDRANKTRVESDTERKRSITPSNNRIEQRGTQPRYRGMRLPQAGTEGDKRQLQFIKNQIDKKSK